MKEDIKIEIELSETNRGKKQIIIGKKYIFNFLYLKRDNSKVYRCTEYKTSRKCNSFIVLNDNDKVLKYKSNHNHLEREYNVALSIIKHKANNKIKKRASPFDLKPKCLFDEIYNKLWYDCLIALNSNKDNL